jgi:hypothetical protein
VGTDFQIGMSSDEDARIQLTGTDTTFTYSDGAYSLDGTATFANSMGLYAPSQFTLEAGSVITVKASAIVRVESVTDDTTQPLVGNTGAKIILKSGAGWFLSTDWPNVGDGTPQPLNIYDSNGTALVFNNSDNYAPVSTDTTYNWDTDVAGDSSNVSGWKAAQAE